MVTLRGARLTRIRGAAFAAPLLVAVACNAASASEPAPCTAAASFDRAHAVVGQQVGFGIRIERRADVVSLDWIEPPTFPGFRAEWLPDRAETANAGARSQASEERRALFPEHAGTLASGRARLRCGTGEEISVVVVPPVSLQVDPPPTRGRPGGFDGLIGPLAVERVVTPQPVRLGESVRVAVMLRGEGNLWLAEDPLGPVAEADVFRRPTHDSADTGSRLTLMRHFIYDIVPLRVGELEIPAVRFVYFDAERGRFGEVGAEALTVAVEAAGGHTASDPMPREAEARASGETESEPFVDRTTADDTANRSPSKPLVILIAVMLGGVLAAASFHRRGRRRSVAASRSTGAARPDGTAEAAAIAQALRRAISPHVEGISARTAEELGANSSLPADVAAAVRLLAEAERARFDPNAGLPDRDAVREAIERL